MVSKFSIASVVITSALMNFAYAGGVTVATLTGKCIKASAMNTPADPAMCSHKVMNMAYPNGRNGFTFVLTAKNGSAAVVSFSGDGSKQIQNDKNHVTQPVDRIMFTFRGSTDNLRASGSCSFANPYQGKPVRISCAADTDQGSFSGEFVSNGVSPDITEM